MADPGTLRFDVELTSGCNAKCFFCPHPRSPRPVGYMSWITWERMIAQAREVEVRRLTVAGFGEPTLHPDCLAFLQHARSSLPETWLQLVTNASRLSTMDLDALAAADLTDIIISFNGYSPQSYERFMQGLSFDTTRQGLEMLHDRLRSTRTRIRIRAILMPPHPEASRNKTANFVRSLGFEPQTEEFYPLHNRGGLVFGEYRAPVGRVCKEFMNTVAIGWDGDVAFCIGDFFHQNVVGNLHADELTQLHARCLAQRKVPETQERFCARCSIADVFKPLYGNHVG